MTAIVSLKELNSFTKNPSASRSKPCGFNPRHVPYEALAEFVGLVRAGFEVHVRMSLEITLAAA
ncbi:hypothetical protein E4U55_004491 [Claviceps digitariae]|nr:hypothetical protein E4U55_004491 [Claviceps digitariae]